MQTSPKLIINLAKIKHNAARVLRFCSLKEIDVIGVVKGCSGLVEVAKAFIAGGIVNLADSRIENIIEFRSAGIKNEVTLLRIPRLSNVKNVIEYSEISVNSEVEVIKSLGYYAKMKKKIHKIVLMIDVGDLREGILEEELFDTLNYIKNIEGICLYGVGTNLGCFGGVKPTRQNLNYLVNIACKAEKIIGSSIEVISGGGTSSLTLLENNEMPNEVNQLRVGEAILLGTDVTNNKNFEWLEQDAFVLETEIIEIKEKPSVPFGEVGRDSFGNKPKFNDKGIIKRAIVALGKQDLYLNGIMPKDNKISVLGGSSDHLILDITNNDNDLKVGDTIKFDLGYSSLVSATCSKYIQKEFVGEI